MTPRRVDLAQAFGQTGNEAPDLDDPGRIKGLYAALAELAGRLPRLAYHDRSTRASCARRDGVAGTPA